MKEDNLLEKDDCMEIHVEPYSEVMHDNGCAGQLTFLPICRNTNNMVVQANSMILGRQNLSLNEAKLVRIAIMQIVKDDVEFKPYIINISELADMFGIDSSNMYRDIKVICSGVMSKYLEIQSEDGSWEQYHWTSTCKYNAQTKKVEIQLDESLKPFLINLTSYYTQYQLEYALAMKSVYAVRIFELIQEEIMTKIIPKEGIKVYLGLETIREACDLNVWDKSGKVVVKRKLDKISHFKEKVLDIAVREIERVTTYTVKYESVKEGRTIVGYNFIINMSYHQYRFLSEAVMP